MVIHSVAVVQIWSFIVFDATIISARLYTSLMSLLNPVSSLNIDIILEYEVIKTACVTVILQIRDQPTCHTGDKLPSLL